MPRTGLQKFPREPSLKRGINLKKSGAKCLAASHPEILMNPAPHERTDGPELEQSEQNEAGGGLVSY